jgi:hypothetical protein
VNPGWWATSRTTLAAVAIVCGVASCQLFRPRHGGSATGPGGAGVQGTRSVEVVQIDERPPLALIAREGDPRPAIAFAAAHDHGSRASSALAALLEARLGKLGFPAPESRAHDLGFSISMLVGSGEQAAKLMSAISQAVAAPVVAGEPALSAVRVRFASLEARTWLGPGEAAAAACSGDAGVLGSARLREPTVAELETWRRAVHSAPRIGGGPKALLSAATSAIEERRGLERHPTTLARAGPDRSRPGA